MFVLYSSAILLFSTYILIINALLYKKSAEDLDHAFLLSLELNPPLHLLSAYTAKMAISHNFFLFFSLSVWEVEVSRMLAFSREVGGANSITLLDLFLFYVQCFLSKIYFAQVCRAVDWPIQLLKNRETSINTVVWLIKYNTWNFWRMCTLCSCCIMITTRWLIKPFLFYKKYVASKKIFSDFISNLRFYP